MVVKHLSVSSGFLNSRNTLIKKVCAVSNGLCKMHLNIKLEFSWIELKCVRWQERLMRRKIFVEAQDPLLMPVAFGVIKGLQISICNLP